MSSKVTFFNRSKFRTYPAGILLLLTLTTLFLAGCVSKNSQDSKNPLPWQREISLREAAKSVAVEGNLNPTDPGRSAMRINNLKMQTVLWGPTDRITVSLTRNNVWDRRLHYFEAPTLKELTDGAYAPINKYYIGVKEIDTYLFDPVDFVDVNFLAARLTKKSDPIAVFIAGRLNDKTRSSLNKYVTAKEGKLEIEQVLLKDLAANFTKIGAGPSLYSDKLFKDIALRPETEELRKTNPEGQKLVQLNRLLIEELFPREISRKPGNATRPFDLGWLRESGGTYDPYRKPTRYAFPCLKPVGQIILGIDPLAGAKASKIKQNCSDGVTTLQIENGNAKASLEYVLGMTSNIYAIRGDLAGISAPVFLRLYRHKDTSHLLYMASDDKTYTNPDYEAEKAFNGPIDAPTSGIDGRYFWIRQRMPAEKTFPEGFEYILMGILDAPGDVKIETAEGKTGLGTPPPNQAMPWDWFGAPRPPIAKATGAAATATFTPKNGGKLVAYVTIVTSIDGKDLVAIAKDRLKKAEKGGFDAVVRENTGWWNSFYDLRENGRIFKGDTGKLATEDILGIYRSWADSHGGGTKTDMTKYECSASYVAVEKDIQEFDSAPCYNEIFSTSTFVRNWGDNQDMWKQIVKHWTPGAQQNARDRFNMPGMLITHGYCPPIKPDKYVHTTIALELCLGTMAEIIRPSWDEWDYGGDVNFLRNECYPMMKEMALFYAAYAKKGTDGYYHVIPSMEEERWGVWPEFSRNKDVISSLCMFRWGLTRAADAADLLGVDSDLSKQWREVAAQLTPYPTWQKPEGLIFAGMPGVEPRHLSRDHFGDAASYPTILADEINLDSPQDQKDLMIRTVKTLTSGHTGATLLLLGQSPDQAGGRRRGGTDAETFLNSRSGRIHLFPVPSQTGSIAFRNFQARGGFLVSACKNANGIYYLEIEPRRDNQCQLMNPWPGKTVVITEAGNKKPVTFKLDNTNGECITFDTKVNHKYLIKSL